MNSIGSLISEKSRKKQKSLSLWPLLYIAQGEILILQLPSFNQRLRNDLIFKIIRNITYTCRSLQVMCQLTVQLLREHCYKWALGRILLDMFCSTDLSIVLMYSTWCTRQLWLKISKLLEHKISAKWAMRAYHSMCNIN